MTSRPHDVLVAVQRGGTRTLGRQIEDQLRAQIQSSVLRPGSPLPSTRDLASELGISRPIVVEAYAQLAAEGYLTLRQGARPRVADCVRPWTPPTTPVRASSTSLRYDFVPGLPDLSSFPRSAWLRSTREALRRMPHVAFGYTDPRGSEVLRTALSDYLGRARGVISDASRVIVTSGWAQGRALVCRALFAAGARRIAVEDPCGEEAWDTIQRSGLEFHPIPVDANGISVEALERSRADAVLLTAAHQYPTGAVLSGERRAALLAWLRRTDATAIEDDYDAEYRYDRAPVGALQGMDAERVVYAGTTSKTLAPALRMGWLVVPPRLHARVAHEQQLVDFGGPRIEQHVLADFIMRGELDRHLRRMRGRYRARRDALIDAMRKELPEGEVCGIAAGLHVTVQLPHGYDAPAIRVAAARRGIAVRTIDQYLHAVTGGQPTLVLGYGGFPEGVIRDGVRELAAAVRETRASASPARRVHP